jgi:hypothetical protein
MRLDYSIDELQFTVGSFNATDYLDVLKLTQGTADLGKAITWTGDFELSFNRKAEANGLTHDDFDPIATPALWRPDQAIVTLTLNGFTFPLLRIQKYVYDESTRQGRGRLYQILDIVAGDRPAEEIETKVGRNGTELTEVVQKLLEAAFNGATLTPTIAISPLTGYLDTRLTSRDPLNDAQQMVATNYAWLWVDNAEHIRTVPGDPTTNPVLFQRSLGQVEWNPDLDNIDFAAEKIIVTGQRQVAQTPIVNIIVIHAPQERTHDDEGRQRKLVTPTYKKQADLYPDLYRDEQGRSIDSSDVLAELKTVLYRYYGIDSEFEELPAIQVPDSQITQYFPPLASLGYEYGDLVETVTLTERTMEEVFPSEERHFFADTTLFVAEKLVERDYCKISYKAKGIINPDGYPNDTTLEMVSAEAIKSGRVNPDGAVNNQVDKRGGPLRLEKGYRREHTTVGSDVSLTTENLKGECNLQPIGWTPFRQKPLVVDLGFLPSQTHADNLARQIGYQEVRARDAISITMPVPIEWLAAGCPPLHRCQIHNAELQINAPILVIDGQSKQMSFSFTGGRIGGIPAIPDPPEARPYVPTSGLSIVPVASIRATVGVAI